MRHVFLMVASRLSILLALVLSLGTAGCPEFWAVLKSQDDAATAVADVANAALPMLVELYTQDGYRVIDKAKTPEEATDGIVAVEKKWKPVWQAWNVLRVAQNLWADTIESKGDTTQAFQGIKDAYCGLMVVWPKEIPVIPMGAFSCGEVAHN